jgi:hypothetical protein
MSSSAGGVPCSGGGGGGGGEGLAIMPRPTLAHFWLKNPGEVTRFIEELAKFASAATGGPESRSDAAADGAGGNDTA